MDTKEKTAQEYKLERDVLAQAIKDAAISTGIASPNYERSVGELVGYCKVMSVDLNHYKKMVNLERVELNASAYKKQVRLQRSQRDFER
jgi:hypothetical protein